MCKTVCALACLACLVCGRRVDTGDRQSHFSRQSDETGPASWQELLRSLETADQPAAFFGSRTPTTIEQKLESERSKINALRTDLASTRSKANQVPILSSKLEASLARNQMLQINLAEMQEAAKAGNVAKRQLEASLAKNTGLLEASLAKNKMLEAKLAEMQKAVKAGKEAAEKLNTTAAALTSTQSTLKMVLASNADMKTRLQDVTQQLSEFKVRLEQGDNILASELKLAKAEVEHLKARETELSIKLQIQDKRLAAIREKAVRSMEARASKNGGQSLPALKTETKEESEESYKMAALEVLRQKAQSDLSSTMLLLEETQEDLKDTEQKARAAATEKAEVTAQMKAIARAAANEKAEVTAQMKAAESQREAAERNLLSAIARADDAELRLKEREEDLSESLMPLQEELAEMRDDLEAAKQAKIGLGRRLIQGVFKKK